MTSQSPLYNLEQIRSVWTDLDFHRLGIDDRREVMASMDPDFATLDMSEQDKVLSEAYRRYAVARLKPEAEAEIGRVAAGRPVIAHPAFQQAVLPPAESLVPPAPAPDLSPVTGFVQNVLQRPGITEPPAVAQPDLGRTTEFVQDVIERQPAPALPGIHAQTTFARPLDQLRVAPPAVPPPAPAAASFGAPAEAPPPEADVGPPIEFGKGVISGFVQTMLELPRLLSRFPGGPQKLNLIGRMRGQIEQKLIDSGLSPEQAKAQVDEVAPKIALPFREGLRGQLEQQLVASGLSPEQAQGRITQTERFLTQELLPKGEGAAGELGAGLGSAGAFLATAPIPPLAMALSGATGAEEALERAEQEPGVRSQEERTGRAVGGAAIGLTELLPLGRLVRTLRRVPGAVAEGVDVAKLRKALFPTALERAGSAGVQAAEEAAQEAGASVAQDVLQAGFGGRPPEKIGETAAKEGALGAGVGALLDLVVKTASGRRGRTALRDAGIDPDALQTFLEAREFEEKARRGAGKLEEEGTAEAIRAMAAGPKVEEPPQPEAPQPKPQAKPRPATPVPPPSPEQAATLDRRRQLVEAESELARVRQAAQIVEDFELGDEEKVSTEEYNAARGILAGAEPQEAVRQAERKREELQRSLAEGGEGLLVEQPEAKPEEETEKPKAREFSSTQVNLPPDLSAKATAEAARIPEEDLAEDGREAVPHITVKFGLHTENAESVRKVLAGVSPITATLGKTSIFPASESGDADVVKVDIESPDLHRLNKKIADALEHTDTHPTYKPHVTLAYVKPGKGEQYSGSTALEGETVTIDRVVFSSKTGEQVDIPLTGELVEATKSENPAAGHPAGKKPKLTPEQEEQALRAWAENRLYVDNGGNYRLRPSPATPTHHPRGPIAPFNRALKARYPDTRALHEAAQKYLPANQETDEEEVASATTASFAPKEPPQVPQPKPPQSVPDLRGRVIGGSETWLNGGIRMYSEPTGTGGRLVRFTASDPKARTALKNAGLVESDSGPLPGFVLPLEPNRANAALAKVLTTHPVEGQEAEEGGTASFAAPVPGAPAPSISPGVPVKPIGKREIVNQIRRSLERLPIRVGGFRQRALGIFRIREEAIHTKRAEDIPVIMHELGHYINKLLWGTSRSGQLNTKALRPYRDELKPLDYEPKKGRLFEGFAEFMRHYLMDPATAQKLAPRFYAFFEGELAKNDDLRKLLTTTQSNIGRWIDQPDVAYVLSNISTDSSRRPFAWSKKFSEFTEGFIDDWYPLKTAVDELTKMSGPVPVEADAYKLARLLSGWIGKADEFLSGKGPFSFHSLTPTGGPSLEAILKPHKNDLDSLRTYLAARRDAELAKRGIETGIDHARAKRALSTLETPELKATADKLYAYQRDLVQYMVDAGVLTPEDAAAMHRMNEDYVPFYRLFEEDEKTHDGRSAGGKKLANLPQAIKKIRGSNRTIVDPLESIVKNTYAFISLAERTHVAKVFIEHVNATHGSGWLARPFAVPAKPVRFQLEEIKRTLQDAGLELENADLETVATIFRPQKMAPANSYIVSVIMGGKRQFYELQPELYKVFTASHRGTANALARILSLPAQMTRLGATGLSPEFVIRNPLRDAMTAFLQSRHTTVPGMHAILGTFVLLKKPERFAEFQRSGGMHAALVSMDRTNLQKELNQLLGIRKPLAHHAAHPIQALRLFGEYSLNKLQAFSEYTELATRLGEFELGRRKGLSPREAGFAARDVTLDFDKMGRIARTINMMVPFFGANVNGTMKFAELHDPRNPQQLRTTMIRGLTGITLPSIMLMAINQDDEEYWEQPEWLRDFFWLFPTKGTPLYDVTPFVPVPKPFIWGQVYGTIPERVMGWIRKDDPKAFEGLARSLSEAVVPPFLPQVLKVPVEIWADKSLFTGQPITPAYLKNLPPQLRAKPHTTEFARSAAWLMNKLDIKASPVQVDHAVFGLGAAAARAVVQGGEKAVFGGLEAAGVVKEREKPQVQAADIPLLRAFVVRSPNPQAVSVTRLYDRLEELQQKRNAVLRASEYGIAEEPERLTSTEASEFTRLAAADETLREIHQAVRATHGMRLSSEQKRNRLNQLTERMVNVARRALGKPALYHPAARAAGGR